MQITKDEARRRLREIGLRVTTPRVAVLGILAEAEGPLSFTQVCDRLGDADVDQATIYRNLVKLREAGLTLLVSRIDGIDRYALAGDQDDDHNHPHFLCRDCGRVACLEEEVRLALPVEGPWAESIHGAMMQLLGLCPDCLVPADV